ncbi:hypothetical protein TRIP_B330243 [uncultured Desulfatiglans sp.]|nr:hypothetical protein TRIP_B330243 [uncultured Desulfatiglans sp.]
MTTENCVPASAQSCPSSCTAPGITCIEPPRFHPETIFLHNLGINLYVRLCANLQVASAKTLDFLDIGQTGTRREAVGLNTRRV